MASQSIGIAVRDEPIRRLTFYGVLGEEKRHVRSESLRLGPGEDLLVGMGRTHQRAEDEGRRGGQDHHGDEEPHHGWRTGRVVSRIHGKGRGRVALQVV